MISITSLFVYRHSGRRLPILFWTRCIASYAGLLRPAALLLCACVACSWATAAAELASTALKAKDPHCANQKSLHFSLLCSWPGSSVAANSGSGKLSCRIPKKGQDLGSVVHQGRHMNAAVSQPQRTAICLSDRSWPVLVGGPPKVDFAKSVVAHLHHHGARAGVPAIRIRCRQLEALQHLPSLVLSIPFPRSSFGWCMPLCRD